MHSVYDVLDLCFPSLSGWTIHCDVPTATTRIMLHERQSNTTLEVRSPQPMAPFTIQSAVDPLVCTEEQGGGTQLFV